MATERDRLLNRIEGDDDHLTGSIVSRNLTRLCIVVTVLMFFFMIASVALAAILGYTKVNDNGESDKQQQVLLPGFNLTNATVQIHIYNTTSAVRLNNTQCLEPQCVQVASRLITYMDTSVDPCEDFYKYSCGGWEDENVLPEGMGRWGTFEELAKSNYQFLIKAMSNTTSNPSEAVTKAKRIFAACTDTAQIQADMPKALNKYLTKTGGWDETNVTQNSTWQINSSLVVEHYYGSSAFFSFDIEPDDMNSSKAVIKIGQSGLTLEIPELYKNESGDDFLSLIFTIGNTLDGIVNSDPELLAYDIAKFERELSFSFLTDTELRNVSALYNPMMLGNFSSLIPQIDWIEYFNTIFDMALGSGNHHNFTKDDTVIVETVGYFRNLSKLLDDTPEETQLNYAKWHVILNAVQYTGGDLAISDVLRKSRFPKSSQLGDDRSMDCVEFVEMAMPFALARPFVDKYITDDVRTNVNATANAIQNAFVERIKEKDWLDNITKQRCIDKVHAITRQIAYPDFVKDNNQLDKFYENLTFPQGADYFDIGYAVGSFQFSQMLSQYGKPVDKSQWLSAPTEVNAYYAPEYNQFVFLAGILRSPFFVANWPSSVLFGAMGVVIGHELTHGFDDQGQQYDKDGNRKNWWTDSSIAAFKNRTQCFVDQYSGYNQQGVQINGQLTLGENIADNGGIHTAFRAYKDTNMNVSLPVQGLTNDQIFFVSFGQVWCSLFTVDYLEQSTKTDPHSPGPIRVKGSIHNSEDFFKVFNCKKPTNTCELW